MCLVGLFQYFALESVWTLMLKKIQYILVGLCVQMKPVIKQDVHGKVLQQIYVSFYGWLLT
ncbi:MAG: hypothetical protein DRO11_09975 [Methanobacteriota archaeon]|nr:MAG: hypothetical protein DRO11_09975 [Euryarchaeota archaeon]